MKPRALITLLLLIVIASVEAPAQSIGDRILRKAKQRANQKIDRTIDKGLDEVEKGVEEGVNGEEESEGDVANGNSGDESSPGESKGGKAGASGNSEVTSPAFAAYSKYDFVPGDKVIAMEDFSQDALGDFPAKWNTNGGGEIVTIDGQSGHWLSFNSKGGLTPEFITSLPENFTLEFDVMVNPGYDFYASYFSIILAERADPNNFTRWSNSVHLSIHPKDATNKPTGRSEYRIFGNNNEIMTNQRAELTCFNNKDRTHARVSIWRQNQRVRLYVNETKVWDLPRAFQSGVKYNAVIFDKGSAKEGNNYYMANLRLAVGSPDTRNKLITEGRFTTTGIYFNTNAADIKPESYGVLKEIADVLSGNPEVKVSIIGHTDSDGDDAHNLDLSKRRAASVRQALIDNFNIKGDRLQADGKGESQPAESNDTSAGKAANRRVEFVKL